MAFPEAYLSRPAVALPEQRLDNEEVLRRIRAAYRGDPDAWVIIETGVRTVFARCGSQYRYIEADQTLRVGDFASRATRACLERNQVAPSDVDMVIYGGIAREYFEPATAMEVAARTGLETVHAFDVTSACVGQMEGIQIACAYLATHEHINTVLVASAELTRKFLTYDIQSPQELVYKLAGLTIGNAAAAFLVRRKPFPGGCLRVLTASNFSRPGHWELCQAPIDGTFTSFSHELFKLNYYVPGEMKRVMARLGWQLSDVDHFVLHQPSDNIVTKVLADMGVDPARAILTHSLYGNTASTTVALAMNRLLQTGAVRPGHKLVLSSAAAGFSMVTAAGEWVE